MLTNDLKKDQFIYGVSLFDKIFEIYTVREIITYPSFFKILPNFVIGDGYFNLILPKNTNIDKPLCIYYSDRSVWFYTTNDQEAADVFQKILDGKTSYKIEPVFENWRHLFGEVILLCDKEAHFFTTS